MNNDCRTVLAWGLRGHLKVAESVEHVHPMHVHCFLTFTREDFLQTPPPLPPTQNSKKLFRC